MSQVIQNSRAKPLRTGLDCHGPLWPEIASEAACSGFKLWHLLDGCGPRQTGRGCLLISGSGVRNPDGALQSPYFRVIGSSSSFIHRLWRRLGPAAPLPACVPVPETCSGPVSSTPSRAQGGRLPWSAPIRADKPCSSISVATVLRKLWVVTPGTPSFLADGAPVAAKVVRISQRADAGGNDYLLLAEERQLAPLQ
jgi:hypothetical protein